MTRGNLIVYTLLGLAVAGIVGFCYAPLLMRPCGCRASLVDRGFSGWKPHDCFAGPMILDLYRFNYNLKEVSPQDHSAHEQEGIGGYKFVAVRRDNEWQISVDRHCIYPDMLDLPGWYLLTADGRLHFSEKGPATAEDPILDNLPAP